MRIRTILLFLLAGVVFAQSPAPSGKTLGTAVAGITIEVFSDFQCPGCKALYEQTMGPLIQDYVRTGRVYLVQRDYPLPQHTYAKQAACYACAANRVGKYEQVCDVLFKKQDSWGTTGKVDETVCSVLTAAEAAKVRALAKDPVILAEVEKDMSLGLRARISSTPTMLISHNGKTQAVPGAVSYPILRRYLDSLTR